MSTPIRVSTLIALTALLALPLLAETAAVSPSTTPDQADVTVVVTDTTVAHPISESIASATVITAKDIREQGAVTVADALRQVPGVTLRQAGQMGASVSTSLRGSKPTQVLVLIDGQRITNPSFISGVDLSKIPVEDIARIEVIRGPVSSLYGSEAFGGVINIITKRPTSNGGDATYSAGSNGRADRSVTVRGTGPVQWLVSSAFPNFDGQRTNSDYKATDLNSRVTVPNMLGWELSLSGESYRDTQGLPGTISFPSADQHQSFDRTNGNFTATRTVAKGEIKVQAYTFNQLMHFDAPNAIPAFAYHSSTRGITNATEATYTRSWGAHQWVFGAEYRNETNANIATDSPTTHFTMSNRALYAQDRWDLSTKTNLVLGTRLDDHSTAGSKLAPRVGINHQIAPNTNIRTSFSMGFRSPNFVELDSYYPDFYSPTAEFGTIGNPGLKPETTQQVEVGLNAVRGKTTLDLALYNTDVRDEIVYTDYTGVPIPFVSKTYKNIASGRQRGVELTLGRQLAKTLALGLSYSYIDARDRSTGNRLLGIPHNHIALTATRTAKRWESALTGRWTDNIPDVSHNVVPGRVVLDLTMTRRGSGAVQPYLAVRNLTDTVYEEVVGYPAEGRSIEVGLRSKW
ncbi:MAG TPA: TonB-dependent receptor [Armatimonadota bacterium]|jgi:outer membrane receptor for ferrienterochelin and colicins